MALWPAAFETVEGIVERVKGSFYPPHPLMLPLPQD